MNGETGSDGEQMICSDFVRFSEFSFNSSQKEEGRSLTPCHVQAHEHMT